MYIYRMLYNIYTSEGNAPLGITDWEHLRVMRLDFTEKDLYNHRYVKKDKTIKYLYKERSPNSLLKKVGFIARDFHHGRPSGQLSIRFFSLLTKYSDQFSIYFYSLNGEPVSDLFYKFGTVKTKPDYNSLAHEIAADEIDILVDMQGFMVKNFTDVLLQKPAPIQIHWLGYPGTLGLPTIDYLVADEILIPEKSQKYYREKIAYLPHCYQSNNPDFIQNEEFVKRGYFNLPEDAFIFTHFNSDYKLDRKTWFVWMEILKAVPNSYLVFTILTSTEEDLFLKQLISDVVLNGIEPKRVVYLKKEQRFQHFNRLQIFNLGLDTYRVNGHTTNADLICAGVPFITYTSETYHNRVGKSILNSLDLDELVCYSFEEYKNKAIKLATDQDYYRSIKNKVITNRKKIMFNTHLYVRSFTNMLHSIWAAYHNTEKKEIEHLFEGENNKKIVPFEKTKLTQFNHHYYGNPTHKWVYHEGKTTLGNTYMIVKKRKQYLIDFVVNEQDQRCMAFTSDGELKDGEIGELIDGDPNNGIWIKEKLKDDEIEEDRSLTLNKDYLLPKICVYFDLFQGMPEQTLSQVVSYIYNQTYLNAELIIIAHKGTQSIMQNERALEFIHQNINYVKYIEVSDNYCLEEILKKHSEASICIRIAHENLMDYHYIKNIYENEILINKN